MSNEYTVILTHKRETIGYAVDSEDAVLAAQRTHAVYPGCKIHCIHYSNIPGRYALRSESESQGSETQAGWWSGTFGWTDLDTSSRFNLDEVRATPMPLSIGMDAHWKFVADMNTVSAHAARKIHSLARSIIPKAHWAF